MRRRPFVAASGTLLLVIRLLSARTALAASPKGATLLMEEETCARVPRAATLLGSDYLSLPPHHQAKALAVADVRGLFESAKPDTVRLVKKSIAEDFPVLVALTAPVSSVDDKLWKPGSSTDRHLGSGADGCSSTMVVVGYDDAQFGGAFEVMKSCGARQSDSFFWIRYTDFERFGGCAVELLGSAPGTTRHGPPTTVGGLGGGLRFEDASGLAMPVQGQGRMYHLARTYPSGTQFRVVVTSDGPAYVYLLASDLTWEVDRIFPDTGDSPLLAYRENRVAIPAGTTYLRLDERPGTDYFLALYSTRQLDFSKLVDRLQAAQGDLLARVRSVVAEDLVPEAEVHYAAADDITFTTHSATGSVVALIAEIQHAP